jgi:UPF0755 protein
MLLMKQKNQQKLLKVAYALAVIVFLFLVWEIYVPASWFSKPQTNYDVPKGAGSDEIANSLKNQGFIKNAWFFRFYVLGSGNYRKLQAGTYKLSPSMTLAEIVKKLSTGDVIRNTATIIEGWDEKDIGDYLAGKQIATLEQFLTAIKKDYTKEYTFLKGKPKSVDLEGFIFPDTYQLPIDANADTVVAAALENFNAKMTGEMRSAIAAQHKTVFQIVTMASLIEKEVVSPQDKRIVSGILWKRIANGMPLQVDAAIYYLSGKTRSISSQDIAINSPYNTYLHYGLPLGPICNPGIESILAAIYPQKSDYWFYLSASGTGKTIFSRTLDEHNAAINKYLR